MTEYHMPASLKPFAAQIDLGALREFAAAQKWSQADFAATAEELYGHPGRALAELRQHFGSRTGETLAAVGEFAKGLDDQDEVAKLSATAAGVRELHARLLESKGIGMRAGQTLKPEPVAEAEQAPAEAAEDAPAPAPKTQADLTAMMRDPRYWRDRDADYQAEVSAGFKSLHPGEVQTAVISPGDSWREE